LSELSTRVDNDRILKVIFVFFSFAWLPFFTFDNSLQMFDIGKEELNCGTIEQALVNRISLFGVRTPQDS
jgi:hypothetical protein